MANEIEKSAIQRAKDFLQITEDIDAIELHQKLRDYRTTLHPDRVVDEESKKIAEEKFKVAQNILANLAIFIQREQLEKPFQEIAPYAPKYELFRLKNEGDLAKDKITELTAEVERYRGYYEYYRDANTELTKKLEGKKSLELQEEQKHLQALYETPLKGRMALTFGIGLLLTGCLAVITQMENVAAQLQKFAPFPERYISGGLFFVMLSIVLLAFKKAWESSIVARKSEEVCSPKYAHDFMNFLEAQNYDLTLDDEAAESFDECDAFNFIAGKPSRYKACLRFFGFAVFQEDTTNRLKDIFLNNLLNKKLIEISSASLLQRVFKIKKS